MKNIEVILDAFTTIKNKLDDIKLINLCTSDGFPICSHNFESRDNIGENELSAAASSIAALSVAAAKQLIGAEFSCTTIETDNGNMLLLKTHFGKKECILCFVTGNHHQIGQVRYFAIKLAKFIGKTQVVS